MAKIRNLTRLRMMKNAKPFGHRQAGDQMLHDKSFERLRRFAVDLPELHPEPFPAQGDQDMLRQHLPKIKEANDALNQMDTNDINSVANCTAVAHKLLLDAAVDAEELQPLVTLVGQLSVACSLGGDVRVMAEDTLEQVVPELEQIMQHYEDVGEFDVDEVDPDDVEEVEEPPSNGPDEILMTNDNMNDIADAAADLPPRQAANGWNVAQVIIIINGKQYLFTDFGDHRDEFYACRRMLGGDRSIEFTIEPAPRPVKDNKWPEITWAELEPLMTNAAGQRRQGGVSKFDQMVRQASFRRQINKLKGK